MRLRTKLLAFDLDGTTLRGDKSFSQHNRRALQKTADSGVILVPATGRPAHGLVGSLIDLVGIRYAIGANGAYVLDLQTGNLLHEDNIPLQTAVEAAERLAAPGVYLYAHVEGRRLRSPDPERRFGSFFPKVEFPEPEGPLSLAELLLREEKPVQKIGVFTSDQETYRKVLEEGMCLTGLVMNSTGSLNVEFNSETASKGAALERLCRILGVPREATLAIGDNQNDCALFRFAGYSVAMDNAIDELKQLADEITLSNDDDGVAVFLEKHWS